MMLRNSITLLLFLGFLSSAAADDAAVIKVDIDRTVGAINPMIYGGFIEHLHRCVYGGIYDPGNPLSDREGFRMDVLAAIRDLRMPILRWPGGNFSSGYHWMDGVGPRTQRPKRIDLAWGAVDNNAIGVDEFIEYCRKVGTEPYICANLGTGTWEEARNWVEYCNRPAGTQYADLRVQNGHPEPYGVKYWGLGNEIDGPWQMGYKNAEDYSKSALEAGKLMKWMDGKIELIAAGSSNFGVDWMEWNRTVLNSLCGVIDYISLHTYVGGDDYYEFMAQPMNVDTRIERTAALIEEARLRHKIEKPIYISFDEYNVWRRANAQAEVDYTFEDSLVFAGFLNSFVRRADVVKMANVAQVVNVLGLIHTEKQGIVLHSIYYALQLYAQNLLGESLDAMVQCDSFKAAGFDRVPYLDVGAAYDRQTKTLALAVVNRHKDRAVKTRIINQTGKLQAQAELDEMYNEDLRAVNSLTRQPVKPIAKPLACEAGGVDYIFPAHSLTIVRFKIDE